MLPRSHLLLRIPLALLAIASISLAAAGHASAVVTFSHAPDSPFFGPGWGPNSVAAGQLDPGTDSHLDLAVSNGSEVTPWITLLRGNGNGTFTANNVSMPVGASVPFGIVLAQIDAGSNLDAVTSNLATDNVTTFFGDGLGGSSGTVNTATGGDEPNAIAVGNLNGDANPDIAVTHRSSGNVSLMLGDGSGGFTLGTGSPIGVGTDTQPNSVAIADLNNDGTQDVVLTTGFLPDFQTGGQIKVLIGNGSGGVSTVNTITSGFGMTPNALAVGDFNGDSKKDLAIANRDSSNVSVLLGNGDGTFQAGAGPYPVGLTPSGITVVDSLNADTKPDLVVAAGNASAGANVSVLIGKGNGSFAQPNGPFGSNGIGAYAVTSGNFDEDVAGKPDIAVTNVSANNISVMLTSRSVASPPLPTAVSPASPANDNTPTVSGSGALAGSTVFIYKDSDCPVGEAPTGASLGSGSAEAFNTTGIDAAVADDSITSFRATQADAEGESVCSSSSPAYTEDSTAPAAPTFSSTSPASPANDNSPEIVGSAEAGSTVKVYSNASCTGTPDATGAAAAFASPGLTVSVVADATTTFHATATDPAGNTSACSTSSIAYTEDSTAPAAPTLSSTSPASPSSDNSPEIVGSAEAGSTVKVYSNASCTGTPDATGTAAAFASPGLTVSVVADTTASFYATATDAAGNASACSTSSIAYTEDSTAPPVPSLSGADPSSPSNNDTPTVTGTAEAGSVVKIFTDPSCAGPPAASGTAAQFEAPGLVVPVAADTTTTLYANATDAAGNISPCSMPLLTYTEDSTAPALPTLTSASPSSPANDNSPEIVGSAEAGTTVKVYSNAGCSGTPDATGTAAAFASPGLTVAAPDNASTSYYATATDPVGNVSGCSSSTATYTEDSAAPQTRINWGPKKKTRTRTATFKFSSSEPGSSFRCRLDKKPLAPCSSPVVFKRLKPGKHRFSAVATDSAGNADAKPASSAFKVLPPRR